MLSFTLAFRNLWRNRRRTGATLLAITLGFAAINLFAGYIQNVYRGLKASSIHGEALGHLTLAKRGFFDRGTLAPSRYILDKPELNRLIGTIRSQPGVLMATPRLSTTGLISNGEVSTIFIATGEDPTAANRLRGPGRAPQLDPGQPESGLISKGLAEMLDCRPGGNVTVLSSTLTGQTNALDLNVLGTWNTGTAATNDKTVRLPLSYVQNLLDTNGASQVVVLLQDSWDADSARAVLAPKLRQAGFDLDIKTWVELSNFYRQVKSLFDLIFIFLFSIVSVVVLMGIINTLSMNVMERIREIGTLRALGMQRFGIVRLFAAEGAVLGAAGCLLGIGVTIAASAAINAAHFSYIPPASSSPVELAVAINLRSLVFSAFCLSAIATLAACWPARYGARLEIVDALGHI